MKSNSGQGSTRSLPTAGIRFPTFSEFHNHQLIDFRSDIDSRSWKFGGIVRSLNFKAINPRDIRLKFFVKFIEVLQQNMSETATKSRPVNIRKFLILSLIEVSALRTVEFNAT